MSAALIQQAIAMGYNAKQILGFLSSQIPGLKKGIKSAQQSGYPEQMILQFLSNQIPSKNPKGAQEQLTSQQQYLKNVGIKTKSEREDERNQFLKAASQTALGGFAAYRLGKSLGLLGGSAQPPQPGSMMPAAMQQTPVATAQTQRGMPSPGPQAPNQPWTPTQPNPNLGQAAQQQANVNPQQAINQLSQPQAAPPAGQGTPQQPGPFTPHRQQNSKHVGIIDQMQNVKGVIQALSGKETPADIAAVLEQKILSPGQKKWISEQSPEPLKNIIEDYLAVTPGTKEQPQVGKVGKEFQPAEASQPAPITENLPKPTEPVEETKNAVLTPSGDIGSLSSEKKGVASVDVDGKQKNFREQDVIKAPIPEKDITDIYEELIQKIPENDRSAMINVAGYDPEHNELIFFPHGAGSALYVYKDIPAEFAEKLKGAMFKAKTTGENLYGAWSEGEESRGAGMFALIRELQKAYGGRGKEYVRKYANVYDFFGPVKEAVKEKERKKREEERARKGKKPRSS